MKRLKLTILVLATLLLVACNRQGNDEINSSGEVGSDKENLQVNEYEQFQGYTLSGENKEIVYHLYKQKLGIYDKNTYTWTPISDIENEFYYNFDRNRTYFTVGHSLENKFSVIQVQDKKVSIIRNEKDNNCIFPLASNKEHYFFYQYSEDGNETRKILEFCNGNFEAFLKTEDTICYGAVSDDSLYYSVYNEEKDLYDIYQVDMNDIGKQPKKYKEDITDGKLYVYKNQIFYIDKDFICSAQSDLTFEKKNFNDIEPECGLLVQMSANKSGDLQWDFIDIQTKEELFHYVNIIDYKVNGDTVDIYCEGKIHHENVR